jgi:hypothetical protein
VGPGIGSSSVGHAVSSAPPPALREAPCKHRSCGQAGPTTERGRLALLLVASNRAVGLHVWLHAMRVAVWPPVDPENPLAGSLRLQAAAAADLARKSLGRSMRS